MKKENKKGAGKPAPKVDTTSTRRSDKRKAEMQAAAVLNGFETWSGMMTFIKNEALKGRAVKVEAVEQPLALDDAHVCGWCKGKQKLVWSCPVCDVG